MLIGHKPLATTDRLGLEPQVYPTFTMSHTPSPEELHNLEITERVASCFSLLGTSFIFFTFLYSPAFRKPVNRLIFYASWGYVFSPEPSPSPSHTKSCKTPFHSWTRSHTPSLFQDRKHTEPQVVGRNALCNVATLLSQSGVRAGRDSHLCQFQGFLIQM